MMSLHGRSFPIAAHSPWGLSFRPIIRFLTRSSPQIGRRPSQEKRTPEASRGAPSQPQLLVDQIETFAAADRSLLASLIDVSAAEATGVA